MEPPNGRRLRRPASLFALGSQSLRPKQNVSAPRGVTRTSLVTTFLKGQEAQLAAAAKAAEGPALISWQHEAIPEIATLILGWGGRGPAGLALPGHRFDLIWVFDLQGDGTWCFAQAPRTPAAWLLSGKADRRAGQDRPRLLVKPTLSRAGN